MTVADADATTRDCGRFQVPDHRPLIAAAGLTLVSYEETEGWERRHRETDRLLLESVHELAAESGQPVDELRRELAEMAATVDDMLRRVLVVAEKPPAGE